MEKKEEIEQPEKPVSFVVNEKALFTPRVGDQQEVLVVSVPKKDAAKYGCKFPDGPVMPVNGCYLRKMGK